MLKPGYKLPPTYRLGNEGMGCFGEPPAHPRYFVKPVYTQHGNSPRNVEFYLPGIGYFDGQSPNGWRGVEQVDRYYGSDHYPKIEIGSERFNAWEQYQYGYFKNCYSPNGENRNVGDCVIYPVPAHKFRTFKDDVRFNDTWRRSAQAEVDAYNAEIERLAKEATIPGNHLAYLAIRKHFPEVLPRLDYIANPPENPGNWWEREVHRPSPEDCPGDRRVNLKHNSKSTWCQFCGWRAEPSKI